MGRPHALAVAYNGSLSISHGETPNRDAAVIRVLYEAIKPFLQDSVLFLQR
jgi:hypothetical protein